MQQRGPLTEFTLADWNRMLATTSPGPSSSHAGGAGDDRGGGGKIINICSLTSEVARRSIAPYTAAKGGLKKLTNGMAIEWAEHKIQVNGIGPGYFLTKLNSDLAADPDFDGWVRPHAGGPLGAGRGAGRAGAVPRLRRVGLRHRANPLRRRRHPRLDLTVP